jgi:hypothetical protein
MDMDLRKEYDDMLETLTSPGWELLKKRFTEAMEQQDHLAIIKDAEVLYKAQGRLITLYQFVNLKEIIEGEAAQVELDSMVQQEVDDFGELV